jgi:hypothetical protein
MTAISRPSLLKIEKDPKSQDEDNDVQSDGQVVEAAPSPQALRDIREQVDDTHYSEE